MAGEHIIEDDKYIMLRLPSDNFRVAKLTKGATMGLGKFGSFQVDQILGHPFGFTYEINAEDKSVRIVDEIHEVEDDEQDISVEYDTTKEHIIQKVAENNREVFDDPSIQAITGQKVDELRKEGFSGQEIIEIIKNSHGLFDKKTMFSQKKYLKRKQSKFLQRFTPESIGSNELIEIHLEKDDSKIMGMNLESLGMIMNLANVKPGGTYLVIDDVCGVLVAAMIERMGGEGLIVLAHDNEHPNLSSLKYMNFSEELLHRILYTVNWLELLHPEENAPFVERSQEEIQGLKSAHRKQYYKKVERYERLQAVEHLVNNKKIESLVAATHLHLPQVTERLMFSLCGSAPIVIFHSHKEALVEEWHALNKDKRVLAPTLTEVKVRPYQTLPGRLHPHMTMRGGGGYILYGTKVFPSKVNATSLSKRRKVAEK